MPKVKKDKKYTKLLRNEYDFEYARWKRKNRSYKKITKNDLKRLRQMAMDYHNELCKKHPQYKSLKKVCICLCQGAALHYVDGKTGIRDFDVYTFYEKGKVNYPYRSYVMRDFKNKKFGKTVGHSAKNNEKFKKFTGKKVDILGRGIDVQENETCKDSVVRYLTIESTETAHFLAKKAVVVLDPIEMIGDVIWPRK
jgi:hypothetical protein